MDISPCNQFTEDHFTLLLSADPSRKLITDYLPRSNCFTLQNKHTAQPLGILVLLPTKPATLEIVNLAVAPAWQGQGLGQTLLSFSIDWARSAGYQTLEIGTSTTSFTQLYLYQKVGFRPTQIEQNFFTRHYTEAIFENHLPVLDMIRLQLDLY